MQVALQQADHSQGVALQCGPDRYDVTEAIASLCMVPMVLYDTSTDVQASGVFPGQRVVKHCPRLPPNVERITSAVQLSKVTPCVVYVPPGRRLPAGLLLRPKVVVAADLEVLDSLLAGGWSAYPVAKHGLYAAVQLARAS